MLRHLSWKRFFYLAGVLLIAAAFLGLAYHTRMSCGSLIGGRWSVLHIGTMIASSLVGLVLVVGGWRLSETRAAALGPGLLITGISLSLTFLMLDIALRLTSP